MNTSMKAQLTKLFRLRPSGETAVAILAGLVVVGLSAAMIPAGNWPWLRIVLRDLGQVFLAGIVFPLIFIRRTETGLADFGLSLVRWRLLLPINLALGALLLLLFVSKNPPPSGFRVTALTIWTAGYVMLTLCFETVFFYSFMRVLLTRAFGSVPAIALTAVFYSLHHMGFQPEYGKLFFVGVMYATACQLGGSVWVILPFFLGVGGTYDVLVQSRVVSPILHVEMRTVALALLILPTVAWASMGRKTSRSTGR